MKARVNRIDKFIKALGATKVIPLNRAMRCWCCDEILDIKFDICKVCNTCFKCAGGKKHGHTMIPYHALRRMK